ncbi:hypothetical protein FH972_023109 [Carpinus fangiana]|uniref:Alpha/beta hydrolase fold-3 domain-containing protein n=1 Tax=Carpinus fangiana TaxID=176857 RepID=A0A5N6KUM9_9ROSI|nr:hypothetical protein FH972_023109 [Carpinus fangiana]
MHVSQLSLVALAAICDISSALLSCQSQSQPNPIAKDYPDQATGTVNGTLAILPIPYSLARSIIPSKYGILRAQYEAVLPNLPKDTYPALLQTIHDHDVQSFSIVHIPDFSRAGVYFPFVDRLSDGYSGFTYSNQILLSNNLVALAGAAAYGNIVTPTEFDPPCDAYRRVEGSPKSNTFAAYPIVNGIQQKTAGISQVFAPLCKSEKSPYPLSVFKNITGQPTFGNNDFCDNFVRVYNTSITKAPYEPVNVKGTVNVKKPYFAETKTFKDVYGVQMDDAFIEYNYLDCSTLKASRCLQDTVESMRFLIRQTHAILHLDLVAHAALLAQDGDALHLDAVLYDARVVVCDGRGCALDARPGAHAAAPTDDAVQYAGIVADLDVFEDDALLDAHARANDGPGSDADVRPDLGGLHEIESVCGDGGTGRFDLAPEIASLEDVKVWVVGHVWEDVLLEADDVSFSIIIVIVRDGQGGEIVVGGVGDEARALCATIDCGSDGGEECVGREEVDAAVDKVRDVGLGLLDVMQNALGLGISNNAAEVVGSVLGDTSAQDESAGLALLVDSQHLAQGERAADISVEDEEAGGIALEDLIAEVVQTASGAQGLVFSQVADRDAGKVATSILNEVAEDRLLVVANDEDLADGGDLCDGAEAVLDDGMTGNFEEGFGKVEGKGPEASASRRAANLGARRCRGSKSRRSGRTKAIRKQLQAGGFNGGGSTLLLRDYFGGPQTGHLIQELGGAASAMPSNVCLRFTDYGIVLSQCMIVLVHPISLMFSPTRWTSGPYSSRVRPSRAVSRDVASAQKLTLAIACNHEYVAVYLGDVVSFSGARRPWKSHSMEVAGAVLHHGHTQAIATSHPSNSRRIREIRFPHSLRCHVAHLAMVSYSPLTFSGFCLLRCVVWVTDTCEVTPPFLPRKKLLSHLVGFFGLGRLIDSGYLSQHLDGSHETDLINTLGRSRKKLMTVNNNLAALGIDGKFNIPLPKIVVIGDQSAGKSSQIEALSQIKVPRASGLCTRCVLHIDLKTSDNPNSSWHCNVSLLKRYLYDPDSEDGRQDSLGPWKPMAQPESINFKHLTHKDELEAIIKRAQSALLNPGKHHQDFLNNELSTMERHTEVQFSPNEVHLEIISPSLPFLTFYDLPGIINENEDQRDNMPNLVRNLAKAYMSQKNTIIMLTRAMTSDPHTSSAGALVLNMNASGRTIGVLTKPDRLEAGVNIEQWDKILFGDIFKTEFGYYVTKQPAQVELDREVDHSTARAQESKFFASEKPWCTALSHHRERFGTNKLSDRLSQLLVDEILSALPEIKNCIDEKLSDVKKKLQALPEAPPDNCLMIVMSFLQKLRSEMESHMVGELPTHDFMNEWREIAKGLRRDLVYSKPTVVVRTGPEEEWSQHPSEMVELDGDDEDEPRPATGGTPAQGAQKRSMAPPSTPSKRQRSAQPTPTPTSARINGSNTSTASLFLFDTDQLPGTFPSHQFSLPWLKDFLIRMNTSGLPNQVDPKAEAHLIKQSQDHWPRVIETYVEKVEHHLRQHVDHVLERYLEEWSAMQLDKETRKAVERFLNAIMTEHRAMINRAIQAELLKPITVNEDMYNKYHEHELATIKKARHERRAEAYVNFREQHQGDRVTEPKSAARLAKLGKITIKELGEDPFETQIEVVSRVRAYYMLAADYFADHLAKLSHYELFNRCRKELMGEVDKALHITLPDAFDFAKQMLAEDPRREELRVKLRKEREQLAEAQKLLSLRDTLDGIPTSRRIAMPDLIDRMKHNSMQKSPMTVVILLPGYWQLFPGASPERGIDHPMTLGAAASTWTSASAVLPRPDLVCMPSASMPVPSRASLQTTYPGKALWTLFAVVFNAIRLPLWILYYIPSSLRPHAKWTLRQAIGVRVVKAFLYNVASVEMKTPLSLKPGSEKDRFQVLEPAKKSFYTGVTTSDPSVQPQQLGGTWHPAAPSASDDKKPSQVILHFHGGAYVIGDGRDHDAGFAARTLLAGTGASHVFCPQYRLACNPGGQFPAALQDAITAYSHLLFTLNIPAKSIVLSGDSAGANLVLALTRYLADHGSAVGLADPLAGLLHSPWVNPKSSYQSGTAFYSSPNVGTDYITANFGTWGAECYAPAPETGLDIGNEYISFQGQPFATKVPLYISAGECEVLLHDCVRLFEELRAVKGNNIELQIEDNAVHDIILTGDKGGFVAEAKLAAKRAGAWLRTL